MSAVGCNRTQRPHQNDNRFRTFGRHGSPPGAFSTSNFELRHDPALVRIQPWQYLYWAALSSPRLGHRYHAADRPRRRLEDAQFRALSPALPLHGRRVVSQFEFPPRPRPEPRPSSGSCLRRARQRTLARGHRDSRGWTHLRHSTWGTDRWSDALMGLDRLSHRVQTIL